MSIILMFIDLREVRQLKRTFIILISLLAVLLGGCRAGQGGAFKDGKYDYTSEPDNRGWKKAIEITVKGGKIDNVVYDEINKDTNVKKSDDTAYIANWQKQVPGADPKAFYNRLGKSLVEKQDVEKVDTVAGATTATSDFKAAAAKALENAKK